MLIHRFLFLQAGRLSAKRFKNSSSEKWIEKWFSATEIATYSSFIFLSTSYMGIEKEILLVSWGNSVFINSMNAQICRCYASFNDATYSETEATPMLHLHGSQTPTKPSDKCRKTAISVGFSDKVGPSGETRTPGILLPKQARYQLRYTRI